jgi:Protein of unknown function (DUF2752)
MRTQFARRSLWALLALACGSVLVLSFLLEPAPEGHGTHTQLGLPPCAFLTLFALPCPACGLTTSFAHLARFALLASLRAHPLGLPLFLLLCALLVRALRGSVVGDSPARMIDHPQAGRAALLVCLALLAVWSVRLLAA